MEEPNENENENENVDERRDLRNVGGGGRKEDGRRRETWNRERWQVQSRETRALGCAIVRAVFLAFETSPILARFIRSPSDESSRNDVGDAGSRTRVQG